MLMIHLCLNRWNSGGSQGNNLGGETETGIRQWLELGLGLVATHMDSPGRECGCLDVFEGLLQM